MSHAAVFSIDTALRHVIRQPIADLMPSSSSDAVLPHASCLSVSTAVGPIGLRTNARSKCQSLTPAEMMHPDLQRFGVEAQH